MAGPGAHALGLCSGLLPQPACGQAGPVRTGLTVDPATPDDATPDDVTLEALESIAVEVAVEAGRLIVDERPANLGV